MRKSNIESLIYNLSADKYCYPNVFETALGQLDHYFCTIGNDVDYDHNRGLKEEHFSSGKRFFIAEPHEFDFSSVLEQREKKRKVLESEYERMVQIFGDKIPEDITDVFKNEIAELDKPFVVMEKQYYFGFAVMAREMIELVKKEAEDDPHSRLVIRTPYPLSQEYSNICQMTSDDNPLMVQLAIAMSKAWIEVLNIYIQLEWYYTAEDVEKYQGASYYYSLEYINKCIETFKGIITHLEIKNPKVEK